MSDQNHGTMLATAAVTWVAIILVVFMILVFRNCQNTDDRILECINLGQSAHDCGRAMSAKKVTCASITTGSR